LRKSFSEKVVLDGIDLNVAEGTIFALLGPNGAGKTTVVQILSTLISADGGKVRIAGHDLDKEPDAIRAAIGVTGQFSAVDSLLTGEENLLLMADLHHLSRREGRRRAAALLERFDLVDAAKKRPATYSGGMRRRLDLAMTLIGDPRVIFLDEPTTGLDPRSRQTMWQIIRDLVASGVTIHNEIARRAPHLLEVLYRGFHYHRLGEQGPHQEPVTPYRIPVFAVRNGQISVRSARAGFLAGHHELHIPFSAREIEAIDLFDRIAREPSNRIAFKLDAGDMVVINNYVVMHARKAFEDYPEPERKRRLLRIWLDAKNLRAVPAEFNQMGAQNGIPYQAGRSCSYDFQKLFREVDRNALGVRSRT